MDLIFLVMGNPWWPPDAVSEPLHQRPISRRRPGVFDELRRRISSAMGRGGNVRHSTVPSPSPADTVNVGDPLFALPPRCSYAAPGGCPLAPCGGWAITFHRTPGSDVCPFPHGTSSQAGRRLR